MAGEIAVGAFKATVGALMDETRDWLAQKLKEGDVTDEKLRDLIVREIVRCNRLEGSWSKHELFQGRTRADGKSA